MWAVVESASREGLPTLRWAIVLVTRLPTCSAQSLSIFSIGHWGPSSGSASLWPRNSPRRVAGAPLLRQPVELGQLVLDLGDDGSNGGGAEGGQHGPGRAGVADRMRQPLVTPTLARQPESPQLG
jgi:hypothetical protein